MALVQTIYPGFIPEGYFSEENITFVTNKIQEVLSREFTVVPQFYRRDIVRVMQRVMEKRLESIPRMNERVVMDLCREYRTHQIDVNKKLRWGENYWNSQMLYDQVENNLRFDMQKVKLANRLGKEKVGGTLRFHYT